jgi:hypothetical protein
MQKEKKKVFGQLVAIPLVLILACVFGTGCASSGAKASGFMKDYSMLQPGEKDEAALVYVKDGVDWNSYTAVMIDPVTVWYDSDADYQGIHPRDLVRLGDYFEQAMLKNLQDGYKIVARPGPGVLRIRAAITDVVPSNPTMDTVTGILPQARAVSAVARVTTGSDLYVGQAAAEAELLDSQTGERLAAAVDRKAGTKGLIEIEKDPLKDAKNAIDWWAKRVRERLDDLYGK